MLWTQRGNEHRPWNESSFTRALKQACWATSFASGASRRTANAARYARASAVSQS